MGYNFGSGSIQDQDLVLAVLEQPTKELRKQKMLELASRGKRGRYEEVFNLFVAQAEAEAGVSAATPFSGMAYKPLQSLFNKMYVRRGQVAMNLIGDLQRGTMYVETAEELDQVRPGLAQSLKPRSPRPNQGQVKP